MPDEGRIVVFGGPSLAGLDWRNGTCRHLIELRPPARRGDVLNAIAGRPSAIVLLDGYYYDILAVGHKELLLALDSGVQVIGAASLGALRAVEMERFGMIGVGRVFRWFRDGQLDGDDEVAVLHTPEVHGFRPTTIALVEIRWALERLVRKRLVTLEQARSLVTSFKTLGFVERLPDRLRIEAIRLLGDVGSRALTEQLARSSIKRLDAKRAIRIATRRFSSKDSVASGGSRLQKHQTDAPRPVVATEFLSWDMDRFLEARRHGSQRVGLRKLFYSFTLLHPAAAELILATTREFLLAAAAARAGLEPPEHHQITFAHDVTELLRQSFAAVPLPTREIEGWARQRALAMSAVRKLGERGALDRVGEELGLIHAGTEAHLVELAALESGVIPPWIFVRAVACSAIAHASYSVALAVDELHRCFVVWSGGARISDAETRRLGCRLFGCEPEVLESRSMVRGLTRVSSPGPTLEEGVRWLAAAESLPSPLNCYREAKQLLQEAPLSLHSALKKRGIEIHRPGKHENDPAPRELLELGLM